MRLHPLSRPMVFFYDRTMRAWEKRSLGEWRAELLRGLRGEVLELGGGTGANLPHYPSKLDRLVISEPERGMARVLRRKLRHRSRSPFPITIAGHPAEELPYPDRSFDVVVSTLVLCSVGDPEAAVGEVFRVLRPGGRFAIIEHVASPPGSRRRWWQDFVNPLWWRCSGNCQLNRTTGALLARTGFDLSAIRSRSGESGQPLLIRPVLVGPAMKPA